MQNRVNFPDPTIIAVNGIEIEVFEAGQENAGNPIVLCHGWPEHAYTWRHQIGALADAGYHVIVPNQRGYGHSSAPTAVTEYDIAHLTDDLAGLLDHFEYQHATFVGHDWGANVVWSMALLQPDRVDRMINLSLPYLQRGDVPWIDFMEAVFGNDHYFVHFNRQPGVADAVFDENAERFLRNLYRMNEPKGEPQPGMELINLALADRPLGDPVMSEDDLSVFVSAFESTGFTPSINWYRNLDRNWHLLAEVDPIIEHPALMIYGTRDTIPPSPNLVEFVPKAQEVSLDCGHWIQEEKPVETTDLILDWLVETA